MKHNCDNYGSATAVIVLRSGALELNLWLSHCNYTFHSLLKGCCFCLAEVRPAQNRGRGNISKTQTLGGAQETIFD